MSSVTEFREHSKYQILLCRICGYRTPDISKRKNISILLSAKINKLYGFDLLNDTPGMLPTVLCSTCNLMICKTYSKYFNNSDESKNIATLPSDLITQLPVPYKWYDEGVFTRSVASAIQCNQDNRCRMCMLGHSIHPA